MKYATITALTTGRTGKVYPTYSIAHDFVSAKHRKRSG